MTVPPISRANLTALLAALWAILVGGIRVFAWDSLRSGFIDVRPLPRVARLLSIVGLVVVLTIILSIFYNDALRWSGQLEPLPLDSAGGRGIFVPSTAVPLTYLTTILAWTLMLTGAIRVMGWVRWAIVICFLFFGIPGVVAGMIQRAGSERPEVLFALIGLALAALIALVLALILLPRLRLPLAVEFLIMLTSVGGLYIIALYAAAATSSLGGVDFVSGYLVPDAVTNPRNLIAPLLYLSGAEMINFGISLTNWGTRSAQRYAQHWMIPALLVALLIYRWFAFLYDDVLPGVTPDQIQQWAGALLAGIVLIPIAIWRARKPFPDRVPLKLLLGVIVGMLLPQLLLIVIIVFTTGYYSTQTGNPDLVSEMDRVLSPLRGFSNGIRDVLYLELALLGGIIAVVAIRSKRFTVAAFGMILAWTQFVWWFMENGRPLQEWRYQYPDIEPWILLALTAVTIFWIARGELSPPRAIALLGLGFFAWVLNFTDFLDNPLSLFFGFAGIFFTAFGILWGVLTAGGKFANYDSLRFPRLNRIVLYLGYVLLTLNITHWYTVTHNVQEQAFNTDLTLAGLRIFGYTAAFLVFVEGGRALLKQET